MQENFRQFLDRLRQNGELVDLHQPVDIRHIATLVDQAKTALYFHNVIGYDMPVVSGIIRSRERAMMALGAETYREIEDKLSQAIAKPIPPKYVKTSPAREVTLTGDDVDLYKLPIPMSSIYDGGPMITAGVVIARDPELGFNSGIYRFMVKEKALTGIDLVTPNNMRLFVQRALERGEPLPRHDRDDDARAPDEGRRGGHHLGRDLRLHRNHDDGRVGHGARIGIEPEAARRQRGNLRCRLRLDHRDARRIEAERDPAVEHRRAHLAGADKHDRAGDVLEGGRFDLRCRHDPPPRPRDFSCARERAFNHHDVTELSS